MKKLFVCATLATAISLVSAPSYATEVENITEEVLSGPSDLNPEKILGPGGIAIDTEKDILMSFGATVRLIPTAESNWDFGMQDDVPGYFNTQPIKDFARGAFNAASAASELSSTADILNNSITNSAGRNNAGIRSAFEDFSNSLNAADNVIGGSSAASAAAYEAMGDTAAAAEATAKAASINGAALVASSIQTNAETAAQLVGNRTSMDYLAAIEVGTAASASYQAAIATRNTSVAGDALLAISSDAEYQNLMASGDAAGAQARAAEVAMPYVMQAAIVAASAQSPDVGVALQNVFSDPAYQAAMAAGDSAAAEKAAQAVVVKNVAAASDKAAADIIIPMYQTPGAIPELGGASFKQATDSIPAGVVAQIMKDDPNATPADALIAATALKQKADSLNLYALADSFLNTHSNESGSVNDGYIRNEVKMYFNAMPKDKKWSFYAALEYDKPIDTQTIDNRGGKDASSSNFGLERLNTSIELVEGLRLHGGWDIWSLDAIESASMVYGDDNPGFWLKGNYDEIAFSTAWLKLDENDFQNDAFSHDGAKDADRDLMAGYIDYKFNDTDKFRFFYAYDRIRNVVATDLVGAMATGYGVGGYGGITGGVPETDAQTVGGYYLGNFGAMELMAEAAYKFGSAKNTGLEGEYNGRSTIEYDDFDISSYALAADIAFELKELVGWHSFKPHVGVMYTSGDDDPDDDTLGGYSGATNAQRFSGMWGGENTIIGDSNHVLGTTLYGYLPEFHGNGTPVFVGGLQNSAGKGSGRGDNPGLSMCSLGVTLRPKVFLIYRTNVNMFHWNEDFYVTDMVNTFRNISGGSKIPSTRIESGYAGTEWDNEVTLALSKNMFIKAQAAFFFPGEAVRDVTTALSGGTESDDTTMRFATELIWNF